ncbi:MAG: DMT family transporter [Bryobacterales bacterium]|nr:DMT family transporter [Bryobacteraceae bacterium]MCZ2077028.1 DMT family transporter [Bryobacterales bacterium]
MSRANSSDFFLLALSQFVWGTGWSAIKSAQDQMGPVTLNVWSLGISVAALYPFVRGDLARRVSIRRTPREYVDYMIMGVVGVAGMTLLYAWGASRSLAANGALISMAVPVLTALIAGVVLGEKLTAGLVVSLVVAITGVLIIADIRPSNLHLAGSQLFPNALLLGGAVCNGVYVVYSKKLLPSSTPRLLLFRGQLIGFAGTLPFLGLERLTPVAIAAYRWQTWLSLLFLGVVYFTGAMLVFYRILTRLDAGQIMVSNYLQPVFGVLAAAVLLSETITFSMLGGGLLVVLGTALATSRPPN